VLVAPDLSLGRLRLTSLILALARAKTYWRIDLRGSRERWTVGSHLARHAWPIARHLVACVLALALALLLWSPAPLQPYQALLMLAAGLGALVLVFGFAMYRLAFVAVGDKGLAVQLPFWRVRFPFDAIKHTRTTTLNTLTTGKWDPDLAQLSALQVDVEQWPQPQSVLKFWLGKLVLQDGIVLPVDDVIGLNRALEIGLSRLREAKLDALRRAY